MTRRERILNVMAKKHQQRMAVLSRELQDKQNEISMSADLTQRLQQLADEVGAVKGTVSVGQLSGSMWLGRKLVSEIDKVRTRLADAEAAANSLRHDLSEESQRERVVLERATEARRSAREEADAKREAANSSALARRR
jgi:putative sterol carrier protein